MTFVAEAVFERGHTYLTDARDAVADAPRRARVAVGPPLGSAFAEPGGNPRGNAPHVRIRTSESCDQGATRVAAGWERAMGESDGQASGRTVIGGRHGSPTVTVALPFAKITNVDAELRDAVAELATLVARLADAAAAGSTDEIRLVREAAGELAARLAPPGG